MGNVFKNTTVSLKTVGTNFTVDEKELFTNFHVWRNIEREVKRTEWEFSRHFWLHRDWGVHNFKEEISVKNTVI